MGIHLVNMHQTSEQRRFKYHLIRYFGKNSYWAQSMRDWRLSKIAYHFGFPSSKALLKTLSEDT